MLVTTEIYVRGDTERESLSFLLPIETYEGYDAWFRSCSTLAELNSVQNQGEDTQRPPWCCPWSVRGCMLYPWSQQGYSMLSLATSPVWLTRRAGFNWTLWSTHALQLNSALCAGDGYRLKHSAKYLITSQGLQPKWCPLQYYTFLVAVIKQGHSSGECLLWLLCPSLFSSPYRSLSTQLSMQSILSFNQKGQNFAF